jgi:hypothetical protein
MLRRERWGVLAPAAAASPSSGPCVCPLPPAAAGSTAHLEWVVEVKARLLTSSQQVAALVTQLLGDYLAQPGGGGGGGGGAEAAAGQALLCLAAWARLGLLHEIGRDATQQLVQASLGALQSSSEQVRGCEGGLARRQRWLRVRMARCLRVQQAIESPCAWDRCPQVLAAAVAAFEEVFEFCPEGLLDELHPSMLAVASAAGAAAAAGAPRAPHAAAWVRAFAAYASARPAALLGGGPAPGAAGAGEALLRLSALPQLHRGAPLALPALEAWAEALDADDRAAGGGGGGSGEGNREGGAPGAGTRWVPGPTQAACCLASSPPL